MHGARGGHQLVGGLRRRGRHVALGRGADRPRGRLQLVAVGEHPVVERLGVLEALRLRGRAQHHRVVLVPVAAVHGGGDAGAGGQRVAGLGGARAGVALQHRVRVRQLHGHRATAARHRDGRVRVPDARAHEAVAHGVPQHDGHVAGAAVLPLDICVEVEPMGVREARAVHAQLGRLRVHGLHERGLASGGAAVLPAPSQDGGARRLRHGARGVVAGCGEHGLERVAERHLVAGREPCARLAHGGGLGRHDDAVAGIQVLGRHGGRHDLRERGDLRPLAGRPAVPERALLVHERRMRCVDAGQPLFGDSQVGRAAAEDRIASVGARERRKGQTAGNERGREGARSCAEHAATAGVHGCLLLGPEGRC